jgi:hypothetical protein
MLSLGRKHIAEGAEVPHEECDSDDPGPPGQKAFMSLGQYSNRLQAEESGRFDIDGISSVRHQGPWTLRTCQKPLDIYGIEIQPAPSVNLCGIWGNPGEALGNSSGK